MMQRPYKPFERIEWLPRPRDTGIPMPPSPFFKGKSVKAREPIMVSLPIRQDVVDAATVPIPPSPFYKGKPKRTTETVIAPMKAREVVKEFLEVPIVDPTPYVSVRRARPEVIGVGGRGREKYLKAHPELRAKLEVH